MVDSERDDDSDFVPHSSEDESYTESPDPDDFDLVVPSIDTWHSLQPTTEDSNVPPRGADLPEGWFPYESIDGSKYGPNGRLQAGVNWSHCYVDAALFGERDQRLLQIQGRNDRAAKRSFLRKLQ